MTLTEHAERQARSRNIPPHVVAEVVDERLPKPISDTAVFLGWTEGGWQGGSNGDRVWAIVRGGIVVTVMFRRSDQPSTPEALRVETVLR